MAWRTPSFSDCSLWLVKIQCPSHRFYPRLSHSISFLATKLWDFHAQPGWGDFQVPLPLRKVVTHWWYWSRSQNSCITRILHVRFANLKASTPILSTLAEVVGPYTIFELYPFFIKCPCYLTLSPRLNCIEIRFALCFGHKRCQPHRFFMQYFWLWFPYYHLNYLWFCGWTFTGIIALINSSSWASSGSPNRPTCVDHRLITHHFACETIIFGSFIPIKETLYIR